MAYQNQGNRQYSNRQQQGQPPARNWDLEAERTKYYVYLSDPANIDEFKIALGPRVNLQQWLAACRDAVENNPDLLNPAIRASLLRATKKAARMGLRPDGKQGVIVERYSKDAGMKEATWQPMVKGLLHLGKRAGVLKDIVSAEIVFVGEHYKRTAGDDPKIHHEPDDEIREAAYKLLRPTQDGGAPDFDGWWNQIAGAYAILESPDGTRTRRAMGRSRILVVRDFALRSGGAVWRGVFADEMIIKTVLNFTMKHVDVEPVDETAGKLFREALAQDTEIEFDDEEEEIDANALPAPTHAARALPAPNPMDRMHTLDRVLRPRETVAASEGQEAPGDRPMPGGGDRRQPRQDWPREDAGQPAADEPMPSPDHTRPPVGDGPAAERADAKAGDLAEQFVSSVEQEIGKVKAEVFPVDRGAEVAQIAVRKDVQAGAMRLKTGYSGLYERLLKAFADPEFLDDVLPAVNGRFEVFYYDLVELAEGKKAA